jgi:hypothetical protein
MPAAEEQQTGLERRLANLKPWRKGQPSPNPKGRPKRMTESIDSMLDILVPEEISSVD